MTARSAGPCQPWTPIWCEPLPITTAAVTGDMLQVATEVLWAKSGRQFDECTQSLRPCARDCFGSSFPYSSTSSDFGWGQWPTPYLYGGQWYNLGCGGCPGTCACTVIYEAKLPEPIVSVQEILIDGAVMPTGSYKMYDYGMLIRTDGQPWPLCNDLNLPATAVGTWQITLTIGTEVPALGRLAVGELARELSLACVGATCKLPSSVQQLVRQGVSLTFLDPNEMFADGKLGLYNSDLFISTFNPGGIAARAQAIDVDGTYARRQTWPP